MKRRPLILIALIVILPLTALTWAALRIAESEKIVVHQRFRELMEDRLHDVNANVATFFENTERSLNQITAIDHFDVDKLRQVIRSQPSMLQMFVLNPSGQITYPDPGNMESLNGRERLFLVQAAKMFTGKDLKEAVVRSEHATNVASDVVEVDGNPAASGQRRSSTSSRTLPSPAPQAVQELQAQQQIQAPSQLVEDAYSVAQVQNIAEFTESSGWFVWYWDRGLNLIYWQRRSSGHIVGCALERARWMADLVAHLPETVDSATEKARRIVTRVRLVNTSAESVYQWGGYEPDHGQALCEVPVVAPLASWRLQCFVPEDQLTAGTGRSVYFTLAAGLCAVAAALAVIAVLFIREYARDMRQASQQVSFVNQVSHELKTPLTNIRMYAELLDRDLEGMENEGAARPKERLNIILSEGQRLSRLIGNVLTFARQQRRTLQPQLRDEVPDRLIRKILDRFGPAFGDQRIDVQLELNADQAMPLDPDFVEQILGNLVSNVEKYAASGGVLRIETHLFPSESVKSGADESAASSSSLYRLTIDVIDKGPGVDRSKRTEIFQPFARVSNTLSYAAGTGIGLSIARELARLHGGDIVLMESSQGCWFRVTLRGGPQADGG
ncbi:MAG: HAMP domain-containing sensor histidine kinase [Fuerstiella sp.]|nr:HAMP domain-containing sensor histidine kinase [Fuerstiella sp.]